MKWLKQVWQSIKGEWEYRKRLREMKKKDPFTYD